MQMDIFFDNAKWFWWLLGAISSLIGSGIVAGIAIQKYKGLLKKLEAIIIDRKTDDSKIMSIQACKENIENCGRHRMDRRKEDKASVSQELANLSKKLDEQCKEIIEMRKQIAGMPATIVKELRSMGFLT